MLKLSGGKPGCSFTDDRRLLVLAPEVAYDKHTHIIFQLNKGLDLRFHDVRKFAVYLVADGDYRPAGGLQNLGPEPLAPEFTLGDFSKGLKGQKPISSLYC